MTEVTVFGFGGYVFLFPSFYCMLLHKFSAAMMMMMTVMNEDARYGWMAKEHVIITKGDRNEIHNLEEICSKTKLIIESNDRYCHNKSS